MCSEVNPISSLTFTLVFIRDSKQYIVALLVTTNTETCNKTFSINSAYLYPGVIEGFLYRHPFSKVKEIVAKKIHSKITKGKSLSDTLPFINL